MAALAAQVSKVSFDGASAGTATLDVKVAKPDVAKGLVHKYVVMVRQNARRGTASTLTKSEVRGGGRKPFKQKGTGNARMGTVRTIIRKGGGVAFAKTKKIEVIAAWNSPIWLVVSKLDSRLSIRPFRSS